MDLAAKILVLFVALLHGYFLVLEMFLWTTPLGLKIIGRPREEMEATKVLAKNQGLYNGFLAVGLVWGAIENGSQAFELRMFFLGCVLVAGVYGAVTAGWKILLVQALPALVAILVVVLGRS